MWDSSPDDEPSQCEGDKRPGDTGRDNEKDTDTADGRGGGGGAEKAPEVNKPEKPKKSVSITP